MTRFRQTIPILCICAALLWSCEEQHPEPKSTPELAPMQPPAERSIDTAQSSVPADTAVITHVGKLVTSRGTITIGFYGKDAPKNVANIVALAAKRFYAGQRIHRVSRNFVIQLGDPRTKDLSARAEWGRGGQTADGKPLPDELDSTKPSARVGYVPGVVAMAHSSAKNSGTSQFFICGQHASAMPYQYTILGRVIDGMDVVNAINALPVEAGGPFGDTDGIPKEHVNVKSFVITPVSH